MWSTWRLFRIGYQLAPATLLNGLSAVIAEAEMYRRLALDGVEHSVDRSGRPFPLLGMAGQVRFIELHDLGVDVPDLLRQHIRDRHAKRGCVLVVLVQNRLGQHVRAGDREFEREGCHRLCAGTGIRKIKRTAAQRSIDDGGRPRPEAHSRLRAVFQQFVEADVGANAVHRLDEVFDHAVGFGMIDVQIDTAPRRRQGRYPRAPASRSPRVWHRAAPAPMAPPRARLGWDMNRRWLS